MALFDPLGETQQLLDGLGLTIPKRLKRALSPDGL